MGGSTPEPQITQTPTKTPQQQQFLESLLSFFPQAMTGFTIGETYGGSGQASQTHTIGEGKGGATPSGGGPGNRRNPRSSPLDSALTGPIVQPFCEGMTSNFKK